MTKGRKFGLAPGGFAFILCAVAVVLSLSVAGSAQTSSYVIAASTVAVNSGSSGVPGTSNDADEPILTIKKRVDEVNVLFIATDRHGKFVRNLNQNDFSIFDDHKPVESILNFRRETDLPIELGLLMDVSGSVQGASQETQRLPDRTDVGIVVRIQEEFRVLLEGITYEHNTYVEENLVFYSFRWPQNGRGGASYRCVATFVGEMGPTCAAVASERMLHLFRPITVVNIGVGGAMSNDVKLCDVVVGDVIDEYISVRRLASEPGDSAFPFRLSGRPYCTTRDYVLHAQHLEFTKEAEFTQWRTSCETRLRKACQQWPQLNTLLADGSLRPQPTLHKGHVASGPVVSGTASYKNSLLARARPQICGGRNGSCRCHGGSRGPDDGYPCDSRDFRSCRRRQARR